MSPSSEVLCPKCQRRLTVEEGWRLATCPGCGQVLSRMDEDPDYD
ncbi:MAG TPA: hypothetical protein VFG07_08835 [Thermoplasmata archaeon]|nr:hypothetical protein [Thermoplasmata archaeon]